MYCDRKDGADFEVEAGLVFGFVLEREANGRRRRWQRSEGRSEVDEIGAKNEEDEYLRSVAAGEGAKARKECAMKVERLRVEENEMENRIKK